MDCHRKKFRDVNVFEKSMELCRGCSDCAVQEAASFLVLVDRVERHDGDEVVDQEDVVQMAYREQLEVEAMGHAER